MARNVALFAVLAALGTAFGASPAAREVQFDRCDDPTAWGCNLGAEFPGARATVTLAEDAGQPCVRLDYDFRGGGRYVAAEHRFDVPRAAAVSFWVRQQGRNSGLVRICDGTDQEHAGGFAIQGDGWQQVTLPLDRAHFGGFWHGPADGVFRYPLKSLIIGVGAGPSQTGRLFIRGLSAVTDDSRLFCAARVVSGQPGNVVFTGPAPAAVQVVIENRIDEAARYDLRVSARDWSGRERVLAQRPVALAAHGVLREPLSLPADQPNYYRLAVALHRDGRELASTSAGVVVTPQPANFGVDDPDSFFGLQQTSDGARTERLGVKWVRSGQEWVYSEHVRGEVLVPDLAAIRRHHQLIMHLVNFGRPPDWAAKLAGQGSFWDGPGAAERWQRYAEWVEAVARQLAPLVDTFEIQNEPDLTCMWQVGLGFESGVARYVTMVRHAAPAIRRGAPQARISGIDVSGGDYDGGLKYSTAVMAQVGSLLDIYTGHPYAGVRYFGDGQQPMWPVRNDERRKCLDTLAMIQQHCARQQFWIGEKGWGLDVKADPLSDYSRDFAACLVQSMTLAHSVPGVERYYWFIEEGCNEGGYEYGLFRGGQPLPAALAYATMARVLHRMQPYVSPNLGPLVQAHCFRAEPGDGALVLWSEGDRARLTVAAMPVDWQTVDLMGRLTASGRAGQAMALDLDRAPLYVQFAGTAAPAVCAALGQARLDVRDPLKLDAAYLPDLTHVAARVRNVTAKAVRGELAVADTRRAVVVPGEQSKTVLFDTPSHLTRPAGSQLTVRLSAGDTTAALPVRVDLTACRAGAPGPTEGRAPDFVLDQRSQVLPSDPGVGWTSPADLSARLWIGWSPEAFHLTLVVHDPVHFAPNDAAGGFWNGDSVQLAFDPLNDASATGGYDADDREYGLVLGPRGARLLETVPQMRTLDRPVTAVREGQETRYQVALPWTPIGLAPRAGQVFGFNVIINQNNGHGRAYWMGLTPGIGESKRPGVFRDLYLAR